MNPTEAAVAALAHEWRTPLTGILAFSDLLATADLPERERGWAIAVKGAAEHLAQLTTLVIDGVRADAKKLVARQDRFYPRALVDALAATLAARAQTKGLAAETSVIGDLPDVVVGDPVRLRAALENLIDNAVKFTEQGRVTFSVGVAPAARGRLRLSFEVSDTGVGLTRAEIARLFRPFAQANESIASRYGGSGLGLIFVKRIAAAMGGTLTVKSRDGCGSTFRLTAVVAPVASERPRAGLANGNERAAHGRSLRILCAEDNPYARVVLNTILTELGHRIDFAGTGEAAIKAVGGGTYDLVLMDLTLPGLDGIAATHGIRALGNGAARVPIIGISGRTEAAHVQSARDAGMNAFVAKPVSPASLAKAIAGIVAG